MKATLFLLVIVAAIFSSVFAAEWNVHNLENGVYKTGIATPLSTKDCQYARLNVPEGTSIVQIDVETSETNYVGVTAGFNFAPSAEGNTGLNSYLFSDNNVYLNLPRRYLICSFDPTNTFSTYYPIYSPSVNSAGTCAAIVPNMEVGGDVYVCLSSYSTPSINVSVAISYQNSTVMGPLTTGIWNLPATGDSAAEQKAWAYKVYIMPNTTYLQVTTSDSSTVIRTPGLWTYAYTTGNSIYSGYFQVGRWYTLVVVSASSVAETLDFTVTSNCDGWTQGAPTSGSSSSSLTCYDIHNATNGVSNHFNGTDSYTIYRFLVPEVAPFLTVNATFNTTSGWYGYVSFNGLSYFSLDTDVNAYGSFSTNGYHYIGSTGEPDYATAHYIAGGSPLNVVIYSYSSLSADVTFTVGQEMTPGIFWGASVLDGTAPITVTAPVAGRFFIFQNFTVEEGKAVNITINGGSNSLTGYTIVNSNMVPVTALGLGLYSSSANIYAPNWTAGSYVIIVAPPTSTASVLSVDFSMEVTDSPSESAAGVATYSLLTLFVAMIVALLL